MRSLVTSSKSTVVVRTPPSGALSSFVEASRTGRAELALQLSLAQRGQQILELGVPRPDAPENIASNA